MIRVENVSKSFDGLKVLEDVSLTVNKGEVVVIIGASGCGKSVFLRLIERLMEPDSGRIFICGEEITAKKADLNRIRRKMGMVYQGFHLFEMMNVLDNITLAPVKLLKENKADAEKNAAELLASVGLEDRKYAMPFVLSAGQKQRVAIARCLAMKPEIMLFDEPTSALDPSMVGEVLATIRMLTKRGMTMVIVTHEMSFAREIATRVLYFDEHGVYEQGTPAEIFDNPQKPKTQAFIRKLKYFTYNIERRSFDLMKLQGGIMRFAEKYGVGIKTARRLQLCAEELVCELLRGCYEKTDEQIDMELSVEYSEAEKDVLLCLNCRGKQYDPFDEAHEADGDAHLGVTILKRIAAEIDVKFEDGVNRIAVKLR